MDKILVWAIGGLLMVWISRLVARRRVRRTTAVVPAVSELPVGSSIAAAEVHIQNSHPDLLEWLLASLAERAGVRCFRTEWRGFGAVIPQVGVATEPVALTIQVESDPDYVPAERDELVEQLSGFVDEPALARLKQTNARLAVMSASHSDTAVTDNAIVVRASTDLDPRSPDVDRVLRALVALTNGVAVDCVNGGVLSTADGAWVAF